MADPELALAAASAELDRGDERRAARLVERARERAGDVPAKRRSRFTVSLAALDLYVARLRGDLAGALAAGRDLAWPGAARSTRASSKRTCGRWRSRTSASPSCGPASRTPRRPTSRARVARPSRRDRTGWR